MADVIQEPGPREVAGRLDDFGEVARDEQRRVAVLVVVRVAGQADDAVVRDAALTLRIQRFHVRQLIRERERVGHLRVHPGLRADSKVVHDAVLRGEVFRADGLKEALDVHETLVDVNLPVSGIHVPRAVRVVGEHGLDLGDAGLASSRRGYANDAHAFVLLLVFFVTAP